MAELFRAKMSTVIDFETCHATQSNFGKAFVASLEKKKSEELSDANINLHLVWRYFKYLEDLVS